MLGHFCDRALQYIVPDTPQIAALLARASGRDAADPAVLIEQGGV
jgi:hypothetical protein